MEMKCDKIKFFQIAATGDVVYGLDHAGQLWAGVFKDDGVVWVKVEMPSRTGTLTEPAFKQEPKKDTA